MKDFHSSGVIVLKRYALLRYVTPDPLFCGTLCIFIFDVYRRTMIAENLASYLAGGNFSDIPCISCWKISFRDVALCSPTRSSTAWTIRRRPMLSVMTHFHKSQRKSGLQSDLSSDACPLICSVLSLFNTRKFQSTSVAITPQFSQFMILQELRLQSDGSAKFYGENN
jgi:hypothetical protein